MRIFRNLILASVLAFSAVACSSQTKSEPVGFDIGACSAEDFMALHVTVSDKEVTVISVNLGSNIVKTLKQPIVYKFDRKDADGSHFVFIEGRDTFELVLKVDKDLVDGLLLVNDQKVSKLYGMLSDGSKLGENGIMMYQQCLQIREGAPTS